MATCIVYEERTWFHSTFFIKIHKVFKATIWKYVGRKDKQKKSICEKLLSQKKKFIELFNK